MLLRSIGMHHNIGLLFGKSMSACNVPDRGCKYKNFLFMCLCIRCLVSEYYKGEEGVKDCKITLSLNAENLPHPQFLHA